MRASWSPLLSLCLCLVEIDSYEPGGALVGSLQPPAPNPHVAHPPSAATVSRVLVETQPSPLERTAGARAVTGTTVVITETVVRRLDAFRVCGLAASRVAHVPQAAPLSAQHAPVVAVIEERVLTAGAAAAAGEGSVHAGAAELSYPVSAASTPAVTPAVTPLEAAAATPAPAPVASAVVLPWMIGEDAEDEVPVITDPMYHSFDTNLTDEYDPGMPNDYETLCEVCERMCM